MYELRELISDLPDDMEVLIGCSPTPLAPACSGQSCVETVKFSKTETIEDAKAELDTKGLDGMEEMDVFILLPCTCDDPQSEIQEKIIAMN